MNLIFRISTMSAGKSLQLLSIAHNYDEVGKNTIIFTSALDDRFGTDKVKSRVGLERSAISLRKDDNPYSIVSIMKDDIDCVLVDEAQFLTRKQVIELSDIVDFLNIPVICFGLKSDFRSELFEGSEALLSYADKIEETTKTICYNCGEKKAIINSRIEDGVVVDTGKQILIGDLNKKHAVEYKPLCRKCFKLLKSKS